MDIEFNIATIEDVIEIINLTNECFHENTRINYAIQVFEKTKENDNDIYLVGRVDNKVVAHAKITIVNTIYEKMNTYAILNHVCVKPDYRRNNYATKMLDEITRICQTRNVKELKLWSNYERKAAHACYKKYGFTIDNAGFFTKVIKEEEE